MPTKPLAPKRIQRKRSKGWRMPAGAVYVGRPTKYGNPFRVGLDVPTRFDATKQFRSWIGRNLPTWNMPTVEQIKAELRGKDLACFCPLDAPCHADVLLEIANS